MPIDLERLRRQRRYEDPVAGISRSSSSTGWGPAALSRCSPRRLPTPCPSGG